MNVDDRQFRLMKLICFPLAVLLAIATSYLEWSIGWAYLSVAALLALAFLIGTHQPRGRSRRR